MSRLPFAAILLCAISAAGVFGQQESKKRPARNYPPKMEGAKVEVYKTVGDVKLKIYVFSPKGHRAGDSRPAAVFFFGGGWRAGTPRQFYHQCKYLASRGMVAMAADYRVASRHKIKAVACVADAKSAVRWIRKNAKRLGVDPSRIVAGGGSAGGHIAACTGTISRFDESSEDAKISSVPNALVLFNPALALAPYKEDLPFPKSRLAGIQARMGVEPEALSPVHHVKKGTPPTLILHGKGDTTVPFKTAQWFADAMKKSGARCKLVGYEGQPHGFFNYGRDGNGNYVKTVREMDLFLIELGYLKGKPTIGDDS